MGNKVTIEVEVDPQGRAVSVLRTINASIDDLGNSAGGISRAAREGDGLAGSFSRAQLFIAGTVTAMVALGSASVESARRAEGAQRFILNSAVGARVAIEAQADAAERLRKELGVSRTEAQNVLAGSIQATNFVGRPQDAEVFTRRLADLRAARGVVTDISELQRQLFTSDEATDKLFGLNPSSIHEEYARRLGTTAEKLSDVEKNQAIVNKVMEEGAKFAGAAADAVAGQAGKVGLLSSRWEDLKAGLGDFVLQNGLVNDSLSATIRLLEEATEAGNKFQVRAPADAAADAVNSAGATFESLITDPLQKFFEVYLVGGFKLLGLTVKDLAQGGTGEAAATARALEERLKEIDNDRALSAEERQTAKNRAIVDAEVKQGRWVNGRRLSDSDFEARQQSIRDEKERREREQREGRTAARDSFTDRLTSAGREENLDKRVERLRQLKTELAELPAGIFDASEVTKQAKKIEEAIEQTTKQITTAVRAARDEVRSFLSESLIKSEKDNPFVSLFVRARTEVDETRRKFSIFGKDFADEMARVREESIKTEIAVARFQSGLQALKYLQEARRLDQPFAGLTGPEERRLDVLNAKFGRAGQDLDLRRRQQFLENPFADYGDFEAQRDAQETLNQILRVSTLGAGRAGREAQAGAVLQLLNQFDPRAVATSADPFFRQLRAAGIDAYQTQRDALTANVRDAVQREQTGNLIQTDARELLKLVRASGLRDDEKLREFLAVTGSLSEKELTPDLRRARADALRQGARTEAEREGRAEARAKKLEAVMEKLDRLITSKGVKVDAPPSNVQVNVGDGLALDDVLQGPAPSSASQLPAGVTPGQRLPGSDF